MSLPAASLLSAATAAALLLLLLLLQTASTDAAVTCSGSRCRSGEVCKRRSDPATAAVVRAAIASTKRAMREALVAAAVSDTVGGLRTSRACEFHPLRLSCPSGYTIGVATAHYGRSDNRHCPGGPRHTYTCMTANAVPRSRARCDNRRSCVIPSMHGVFGDPCPGTNKHGKVVYWCRRPPAVPTAKVAKFRAIYRGRFVWLNAKLAVATGSRPQCVPRTGCSGMRCGSGKRCKVRRSAADIKKLQAAMAATIMAQKRLVAAASRPKFAAGTVTTHACDFRQLQLVCPGGYVISISSAFYGRTNNHYCPGGPRPTYSCSSRTIMPRIKARCNNRNACTIPSMHGAFGDPCSGTSKYGLVHYRCKVQGGTSARAQEVRDNYRLKLQELRLRLRYAQRGTAVCVSGGGDDHDWAGSARCVDPYTRKHYAKGATWVTKAEGMCHTYRCTLDSRSSHPIRSDCLDLSGKCVRATSSGASFRCKFHGVAGECHCVLRGGEVYVMRTS